jgi:HAD superfamily hydrolase (TIGR01509 family)
MTAEQVEKKVIIFDFDGVLRSVSWEGLHVAYVEIIKAKGKDPNQFFTDLQTFQSWFDLDWHKNIIDIDGVYLDNPTINALFHKHYDSYVQLFPWVEDILTHLSQKYKLAILSSSSIHSVKQELGDVARFFSLIVGAETVTHLKPHPEGVHHILNHFGVLPEGAIIIGDTPHDLNAGFAAGIWTGAVKWGLAPWSELHSLNADMYFEHPSELFLL